jgi:hypothetical protein
MKGINIFFWVHKFVFRNGCTADKKLSFMSAIHRMQSSFEVLQLPSAKRHHSLPGFQQLLCPKAFKHHLRSFLLHVAERFEHGFQLRLCR